MAVGTSVRNNYPKLSTKDIDTDRPGYERAEIDALLGMLDDHPLSIELVTPHLKTLTPKRIRDEFGQLLDRFAEAGAHEDRNRSLLASLEFSRRRLSPAAQAALPYLAWFAGGVFEFILLDLTELAPEAWDAIRAELEATALINVELEGSDAQYIRFHPTLPYAARPGDVPDPTAAEQSFIAVYGAMSDAVYDMLRGRQPAAGMALLAREEANLRAAIERAFRRGERQAAWSMADTLRLYLERAGRLRERDALTAWVRDQMPQDGGLDESTCAAIRQHAWSRFSQGAAAEAIQTIQALLARLASEGLAGGADPAFQLALSHTYLGRMYDDAGLAREEANLRAAITLFEQLGDAERGNLSTALGDLANAYRKLGQLDAALTAAERGLAINRELGRDREIAAGSIQIAQILMEQQRYAEADARYGEGLQAARTAGDMELQGITLQHQGSLQRRMGNHDRAIELYRQAIALFQRAGDLGGEMQTCDLIASAERKRSQLEAAAAWYARSRELALQLNDRHQLGIVAQNVGILYQQRAEQAADPGARAALLRQAVASIEESLAITLELQDQVGAAMSYSQLGVLYRMLGQFDQAETHALQALHINEALGLPDVYKDYGNLARIARARGDADSAAGWQAKRDAKVAELERLRRGESAGPSEAQIKQITEYFTSLAEAAYAARKAGAPLPPDAAEALAELAQQPPPWSAAAPFLQAIAAGQPVPPLPVGLPQPVMQVLQALVKGLGG